MTPMAMTSVVKDELSRVPVIKPCCRKAEAATLLRFAGGLHLAEGRVVIEAELDTGAAARRLRASITEVFGHPAEFLVLAPSGRARVTGTWSGWTRVRPARPWPARPG